MRRLAKLPRGITRRLASRRAGPGRTGLLQLVAAIGVITLSLAHPLWSGSPALTSFDPVVTEVSRRDLTGTLTLDGRLERTETRAVYWNDRRSPRDPQEDDGQQEDGMPPPPASRGEMQPNDAPGPTPPRQTPPSTPSPTTATSSPTPTPAPTPTPTATPTATPATTPTPTPTSLPVAEPVFADEVIPAVFTTSVSVLAAQVEPTGSPTLTHLAPAGSQLEAGDVLYAVDARPTVLMDGTLPTYRDLHRGVEDGQDVAQLQQNLVDLGFAEEPIVDGHYGAATAAAVETWQEDVGLPRTGEVRSTDVVFAPAPVLVSSTHASTGSSLRGGTRLLDLSTDTLVATARLPVRLMDDFEEGDAATVRLADGTHVEGTVRSVGTDATRLVGTEVTSATVEFVVQSEPTSSDAAIDFAEAEVILTIGLRRGVLTVPVSAVVDGGGGSPAVVVPTSEGSELVPVELGLVADGYVEVVAGAGEGQQVLLPGRTPEHSR